MRMHTEQLAPQARNRPLAEVFRVCLLIVLGAALMEPYLTHGTMGGSDAIKYSNGVADFITQVRAGVFPVWIGQTQYAMFGGEFPPRFAPVLQHQAALVDILTGRRLPLFLILNVSLTLSLVLGLFVVLFLPGASDSEEAVVGDGPVDPLRNLPGG